MRLSEIVKNPDRLRPENFWLWHPVLVGCLRWVQSHGLAYPFLFGKRNTAASFRLPRDRVILRIARTRLDKWQLSNDASLREARVSCQQGCWWDGHFRRWLASMPLVESDILTRWAHGETFPKLQDQKRVIRQLHRFEERGMWRYSGVVSPDMISVQDPDTKYYVGVRSYRP